MGRRCFRGIIFVSFFHFFLLSINLAVPSTVVANDLRVAIDSIEAVEGDSLRILEVYLDNPLDTIAGFMMFVQMNLPDWSEFLPPFIDSAGALLSSFGGASVVSLSGTNRDLRIIASGGAGIPPQTDGLLLRIRCKILDAVPIPLDSQFTIIINQNPSFTHFANTQAELIGTKISQIIDTTCYTCTQWQNEVCLQWIVIPYSQAADSMEIDTFPVATYDPELAEFVDGYVKVQPRSGDANCSHRVDVGDAVFLINHVFKSGPPPAFRFGGDANCNGNVNVADAVVLINFIFNAGEQPYCLKSSKLREQFLRPCVSSGNGSGR